MCGKTGMILHGAGAIARQAGVPPLCALVRMHRAFRRVPIARMLRAAIAAAAHKAPGGIPLASCGVIFTCISLYTLLYSLI
jgi:hypothetical protein